MFRVVVGYGYRPFYSLWALGALLIFGFFIFFLAWSNGEFAPSAAVILVSDGWLAVQDAGNPAEAWEKTAAGQDYETFNALAYAADIVVPIIDLGQEDAWAPTTEGPIGTFAWAARWFLKILGWIAVALGAAALTGVVRRD